MLPENTIDLSQYSVYITNEDGTRIELPYINSLETSMEIESTEEISILSKEYSGSFSIKSVSKNLFRLFTDKSYIKYLKRVKNRNRLYNKLKEKGRKL